MFPSDFPGQLSGLTFDEIFIKYPNWIEMVRCTWIRTKCTGLFLEFYDFVIDMLMHIEKLRDHTKRCNQYVIDMSESQIPEYMMKYISNIN